MYKIKTILHTLRLVIFFHFPWSQYVVFRKKIKNKCIKCEVTYYHILFNVLFHVALRSILTATLCINNTRLLSANFLIDGFGSPLIGCRCRLNYIRLEQHLKMINHRVTPCNYREYLWQNIVLVLHVRRKNGLDGITTVRTKLQIIFQFTEQENTLGLNIILIICCDNLYKNNIQSVYCCRCRFIFP